MKIEAPTEEELAAAPLVEGWELVPAALRKSAGQMRLQGAFFGHPEIGEGRRGRSSDVLRIDDQESPGWAVCRSRVYRLGRRK